MGNKLNSNSKPQGGMLARLKTRAASTALSDSPIMNIPLDRILFDMHQPRQAFHAVDGIVAPRDQDSLEELAASIKSHGLIHPITVSEQSDGRYLVRVGERRTRACMLNGDAHILARVRNDLDGTPALALQLAENTDRQELTDREIADTIARLLTKTVDNPTPMSKADVARLLGKSPGWVTRYLTFGDDIKRQKWVAPGYVETPEILYLLTLLPEYIQEIVYADMSTGRVQPPLRTKQLEYYKAMAKRLDERSDAGVDSGGSGNGDGSLGEDGVWPFSSVPVMPIAEVSEEGDSEFNAIAAAMQSGGVVDGTMHSHLGGGDASGDVDAGRILDAAMAGGDSVGVGAYQLPEDVAQGLRVPTYTGGGNDSGSGTVLRNQSAVIVNTAVPCRIPMTVLGNLVSLYSATMKDMSKIDVDVRFPSAMAVALVRELTGQTVEEDKVGVLLAKALATLQ